MIQKQNTQALLHIAYWLGAGIDFLVAIAMLFPSLTGLAFGFPAFTPGPAYRYAMGMGASLMLGWTVLLIWADNDPLARKGILIITVFPVITGISATVLQAYLSGWISLQNAVMTWLLQSLLSIFFTFSYSRAVRYQRSRETINHL